MDAWEFFNTLFDKLEQQLKGTKQEKLLRNMFGGCVTNQLIGTQGCQHQKERDKLFYTISVDIKNNDDLMEALDLFVQGEMLTGDNKYLCEECEEPVSTLKRCCIKELPQILVIHLKRFEFDYEAMVLKKLNSACSFPMSLNMEAYTKEVSSFSSNPSYCGEFRRKRRMQVTKEYTNKKKINIMGRVD